MGKLISDYWQAYKNALGHLRPILGLLIATVIERMDYFSGLYYKYFSWNVDESRESQMIFGFPSWYIAIVFFVSWLLFFMWKRVVNLERQLKPNILLEAGSGPDFIRKISTNFVDGRSSGRVQQPVDAVWVRIRAINNATASARACRAYLLSIHKVGENGFLEDVDWVNQLPLRWSNQPNPSDLTDIEKDLPPDVEKEIPQYIDVCVGVIGEQTLMVRCVPNKNMRLYTGTYRISVRVVGEGCRSDKFPFELTWGGDWESIKLEQSVG